MTLDERDPIDGLLREALRRDVGRAEDSLAGLESRVLKTLGERVPRRGVWGSLKTMVAPTKTGRWVQVAFVAVTAAACLALGTFLGGKLPFVHTMERPLLGVAPATKNVTARAPEGSGVLFMLSAPNAKAVSLVGSFSEWEPLPLTDDNHDGVWTTRVPLSPGRYEYAFIIDGRWFGQDPSADEYIRSFGEYSSVRYIDGGGDGA